MRGVRTFLAQTKNLGNGTHYIIIVYAFEGVLGWQWAWGDGWKSFAQGSKSIPQERTFMSSSTCWWGNSSINHNLRHTATIEKMKAVYMVKPPSTLHNELWPVVPNIFQAGLSTTYYSLSVPNIRDATCQMLQGRPKDLEIRLTKIHAFRKEEAVSNIIKIKLQFNLF